MLCKVELSAKDILPVTFTINAGHPVEVLNSYKNAKEGAD
jgi:hypothetical protein